MPDADKIEEFLDKLKPCIDRGELDACVDEAARLAEEMGINARDLVELSFQGGMAGTHVLAYVLAGVASQGLEGRDQAVAYSNAGCAAAEIGYTEQAEENYKKAIEICSKHADAHYNYANLLDELNRKEEAEEQYKQAIEADPKHTDAHYNYAILLHELKKLDGAEEQYKLAIDADPKHKVAHYNYAILLQELKELDRAEEQYKLAIDADPKHATAHGNYSILLIEKDNRKKAWDKTQKASSLFAEEGDLTKSHIQKAWFYELYSEKYFNQRKFLESGEDVGNAGDEYLKASETTDADLKDTFSQQGNILKAKSFVRKVPKKSWRRKILYRIGRKHDIPDIINNLKEAASYYEKASLCPVDEKQDICNACHISISVFSETLFAMEVHKQKKRRNR